MTEEVEVGVRRTGRSHHGTPASPSSNLAKKLSTSALSFSTFLSLFPSYFSLFSVILCVCVSVAVHVILIGRFTLEFICCFFI